MNNTSFTVAADCEIVSSRVFNHPRKAVFKAWTTPELLMQWWGPAGFSNTFYEFDLKPGGRWRFTMHGPEKGHYENEVTFIAIEEPSLIAWDRISKPLFRVVTTFEEAAEDKTLLEFRMQFATREECDKLKGFVVDKNEENFTGWKRYYCNELLVIFNQPTGKMPFFGVLPTTNCKSKA